MRGVGREHLRRAGRDDHDPLGDGETGGKVAAPIWLEFMKEAMKDRPITHFPIPPGVRFVRLEGKGNLAFAIDSSGGSVYALTKGLNGTAALSSRKGAIAGFNVEQLLKRIERRPLIEQRDDDGNRGHAVR